MQKSLAIAGSCCAGNGRTRTPRRWYPKKNREPDDAVQPCRSSPRSSPGDAAYYHADIPAIALGAKRSARCVNLDDQRTSAACWLWPSVMPCAFIQP